ncbi:uncharacterized protein [Medicago truncatula]|uniref:uncharacterized protein n=1 Tax=Medicago truncatula TaxID=3880 RepID=UPI0019686B4D|nr:uncharacterized protein LOC112420149 [Medicago truncatula]
MAFPLLWRKWIKECISTTTASILVNGSPTDEFSLHRGLRQGDPLSPFLFMIAAEGLNVLMKSVVENNLFKGYVVGASNSVVVSHLQFADDTLLLGEKSWANVRALRAVLTLFAEMSGLKVNFNKSLLVGVNIGESWLLEAASVLNCKVGKILFLYLGLSIGGDPRKLAFWEPVVSTIKTRLSGWQSCFLSFGGRLVLLKSVLTSLPVYALSFFKSPSDRGGFWYRVLVARYGEEARRLEVGGRSVSSWWKEVAKIKDGVGEDDEGWFVGKVSKLVGDGSNTLFWFDRWLGDVPFNRRFARLFDLTTNKMCTVADMYRLGWEEGGDAWVWRRRLWAWEEECRSLLDNVRLRLNVLDRWQWDPDTIDVYTVRGVYQILTTSVSNTIVKTDELVWHKQVPLN